MKVHIEIGEVVFDGFDFSDQKQVISALEKELVLLLKNNGVREGLGIGVEANERFLPTLRINVNLKPAAAGVEIAKSIFGSLQAQTARTKAHR